MCKGIYSKDPESAVTQSRKLLHGDRMGSSAANPIVVAILVNIVDGSRLQILQRDEGLVAGHHGQASWPQVCRKVGDKQSRTWPEKERIRTEKAKKDLVALMKEQHELAQLIDDAEYKVAECRATKIDKKGTVFFDVSWQGSTRVFGWSPREDFADDEGTIICKPVQEFVCKQERKEKQKNEKEKDKQDRAALKEKQKTERMAAAALVAKKRKATTVAAAAAAKKKKKKKKKAGGGGGAQ